MGAELQKLLPVGNGQRPERGAALCVGDTGQRRGREGERGVARGEQLGETIGGAHGFFLAVSGGAGAAGGRASRCTPSAVPATTTRSILAPRRSTAMRSPRE